MPIKPRETETADADDETRALFKAVAVFDRWQVGPIEGREQAPLALLALAVPSTVGSAPR
jgi:hypothetical protein